MKQANKKRRADHLTVSLFPFLAVLICTLGILIVLLVISVQSADVKSRNQRDANRKQQLETLTQLQERATLMSFEAENIESVRADVSERLAIAKSDRSYLEQQLRQIESDARQLLSQYQQIQRLKKNGESTQETVAKESIETLQSRLDDEESRLKALQAELNEQGKESKFQIVPYAGNGGTDRRPVFVECDAEGLILQPHGIRLKKSDFINPNAIGNVLDSALLAVRDYHRKHQLTDDTTRPYPLLVVRPNGAWSYSLARRAMKSWDDEFGYELVEESLPLDFGVSDPALKNEIETAIQTAQNRQTQIAMRTLNGNRQRFGTTFQEQIPTGRGKENGDDDRFGQTAYQGGGAGDSVKQASQIETRAETTQNDRTDRADQTPEIDSAGQHGVSKTQMHSATGDAGGGSPLGSSEQSLAQQRGNNWALPTQASNANAYVRPIRLACESNRLTVLSQDRVVATILIKGSTHTAVNELVSAVWETIESWGVAGRTAYWKPELRFSIMPGGEQRYADLKVLLDESGLIVSKHP